jgi:hypothetical protein
LVYVIKLRFTSSLNQKLPLSRGGQFAASLLERGEDERVCEHIGRKYTVFQRCVKGFLGKNHYQISLTFRFARIDSSSGNPVIVSHDNTA